MRDYDLFPERRIRIDTTDEAISYELPDGRRFVIAWKELQHVEIETTDQGPFVEDVFWRLSTKTQMHTLPQGATGESELFKRLQALPGFNNEAVVEAMGATENRIWTLWQRPSA